MSQVYANITWNDKKQKKETSWGKGWGKLSKEKANASAITTGDGLVVVDIDTHDMSKLDPKLVKMLPVHPTVKTKRGMHYYFEVEDSKQFVTSSALFEHVDIRSEGGVVFNAYWGTNENISYHEVNDYIDPMPKKLSKYLLKTYAEKRGGTGDKKKSKTIYNNTDIKKMKKIMKHISCYDDYDEWYQVGMALKDWDEVDGLKVWDKWSKQSEAYEAGACDRKWGTFDNNGDIGVGTLYHLAESNGYVIEHEPEHTKKKGKGKPLGQMTEDEIAELKGSPRQRKKSKVAKGGSPFDAMDQYALDDNMLKDRANQTVLYNSVVIERMHTYVYGKSGSNKTTIFGWMAIEILKAFPDKKVQFWSFDAHNDHEKSIYNYMKANGLDKTNMQILSSRTAEDYYEVYQDALDAEQDMSDLVLLIDTFKFITQDVNSKNANKKAMHFIKELLSAGATVVSLGHSNKDGMNQSGTAEIEQDSDAILRIDREVNAITGEVTASIQSAGRCRFNCSGVTFKMNPKGSNYGYLYSSLESLRMMPSFENIAEKVDEEKAEVDKEKQHDQQMVVNKLKDEKYIEVIVALIKRLTKDSTTNPTKIMITKMAQSEESMGKSLVDRLLRDYNKDVWEADSFIYKGSGGRPTTQ